jgi:hypothetical protein
LDDDREQLERLSFFRGLTDAAAIHTTPAGEPADFSDEMAPRVGFAMHKDNDGEPMLSIMLDFSDCEVASRLGQKSMMVAIHELTRDSLDALDIFAARVGNRG